mgnify:CR=1 FL=1|tara:strand:+ start:88 stop:1119 length:1032 start_codon:yes stop_codon:yes gene_type:complete
MKNIYNLTISELRAYLAESGFKAFIAKQVFDWVYKKGIEDFSLMSNLSKDTQNFLKSNLSFSKLVLVDKAISKDGTKKYLFRLSDKALIETVFIPQKSRATICLSTQVGCKFKCSFCASGADGLMRNLEISEIIGQYLYVLDDLGIKITNIVFMGIGEPLDNFDNLIKSIDIFKDKTGIGLGKRKISISTSGLAPQIEKLAKLKLGVKLSVSLHSADDRVRSKLMPVNKKWPLRELKKALNFFVDLEGYPISFEYLVLAGVNIKKEDAAKLANFLKGLKAKVNLIPYNRCVNKSFALREKDLFDFERELERRKVFFSLRKSRGQDIDAACGQLRAAFASKTSK